MRSTEVLEIVVRDGVRLRQDRQREIDDVTDFHRQVTVSDLPLVPPVITTAIPALYGANGVVAGWIAHLFHSVVFGLIFAAAVVSIPSLNAYAPRVSTSVGLGIGYGVLVWIVAAAIVMPIWLGAVGFGGAPPLPNFNPMSLVGHVVFGVVLGGLFPVLRNR